MDQLRYLHRLDLVTCCIAEYAERRSGTRGITAASQMHMWSLPFPEGHLRRAADRCDR